MFGVANYDTSILQCTTGLGQLQKHTNCDKLCFFFTFVATANEDCYTQQILGIDSCIKPGSEPEPAHAHAFQSLIIKRYGIYFSKSQTALRWPCAGTWSTCLRPGFASTLDSQRIKRYGELPSWAPTPLPQLCSGPPRSGIYLFKSQTVLR